MEKIGKNIWEVIETLSKCIPFTKESVERQLGPATLSPQLFLNQYFDFFKGGPIALSGGVNISEFDLRIGKAEKIGSTFLALEISGDAPKIDSVKPRFFDLQITDIPRGRSLDEAFVYTTVCSWGRLSFAFKERSPDLLSSVVFDPN